MSAAPDYGETFAHWRSGAGEAWTAYTDHAFVRGLRDGTLPRAAFLHYLVQDYVFLVHFSRAWALGVVKSETMKELRNCAATVDGLVNTEMALHIEVCAQEGIREAELFAATEEPENLAYTRYVIDAGLSGDFLDLMAALAPCVLGYGEIGHKLGSAVRDQAHPYAEWINTYAGEEYQSVCRDVGAMLDQSVANRIGGLPQNSPRWGKLQSRFTTACRLEAGFWGMGLRGR
ncbi:thiaminase II [Halocynthiibacter sp. C4]|uniref:thiaminase II n=1 Tax=Halocynthiibacter sp. C4 TaxID=2992758 RepID=UPI00237BE571|nr:thiaminase II [Halocynthiibacter sp. C4]MDE0590597.1 thiaminase II [Halocynthiibacter sp. C4]